jgi:homoserine O-acetyltransferase
MDWQTPEDAVPSAIVTEADQRALLGKPPATGAWREGDPPAWRRFVSVGTVQLEGGGSIPGVRVAYETFGRLSPSGDNAVLVLHALTGDSHLTGPAGPGQPTGGWWSGIVGPGLAIDTDHWFVVAPNMLGGCQGTTGPASLAPDLREWGPRFPQITIRDQVETQRMFADALGIERWAAVVGGSMGGMQALEWALTHPERVERLALLAAPAASSADQIALNSVQLQAIRMDPKFRSGWYYGAVDGDGPTQGLALARRMALLNYRSPSELNARFRRSWQSTLDPLLAGGRFAVESYLDFHGNKFTRRFDANSYIRVVQAMSSHDVGRGRGGVEAALATLTTPTLVLGIDSDRLYPVEDQRLIARLAPGALDGDEPIVISSEYGPDGFLIENELVGRELARLLTRESVRS